jgi:hypothetical protein
MSAIDALAFLVELEGHSAPAIGYNLDTIDGRTAMIQTFTLDNGYPFDYRTHRFQAVKEIRSHTGHGLKASKDAVDLAIAMFRCAEGQQLTPSEWELVDDAYSEREREAGYQYDGSFDYIDEPPF